MNLLVTALHPEAKPFIEFFKLKRDLSLNSVELYRGDEWSLVISGMNPLQSAIATTTALQKLPRAPLTVTNVGVGASTEALLIGTLTKINKVTDSVTGKSHYPELTVRDGVKEAALTTVHTPQFSPPEPPSIKETSPEVYDMEGFGFFSAAMKFAPLESIALFKVISDHFKASQITKEKIQGFIEAHVDTITNSIRQHSAILNEVNTSLFTPTEEREISNIESVLALTEAQKQILREQLSSYRVRKGEITTPLSNLDLVAPTNKSAQKKVFQEVLHALN